MKDNHTKERLKQASKDGKDAAAKLAASNPLIKKLAERFNLRLDLDWIATYGTKLKEDE